MKDGWGQPIGGSGESITAWDQAWASFMHFTGDPADELATANRDDDHFVLGPVFTATYTVLAGSPLDAPELEREVRRARERTAAAGRERLHLAALEHLVRGDFTSAGEAWDEAAADSLDFAAVRFAHDVYLHVGDNERRLHSSEHALARWSRTDPGYSFLLGQHSFSLGEMNRLEEAEHIGQRALEIDPDDAWARHALAHVYETTGNTEAAIGLLRGSIDRWSSQALLAHHIWWHLAVRLLAADDIAGALEVHDLCLPDSTTAFRLCDQASLLWRIELRGRSVGDRWDTLADRWDAVPQRHTCGFLDLHAALTFSRRPHHPGANRWFEGLAHRADNGSENDEIYREVVQPLVEAVRAYGSGRPDRTLALLDRLGDETRRIGGSNAQRNLIELTRRATQET